MRSFNYMSACVLRHIWLFAIPWIVAWQSSLSMEFPRQEYWGGLPFPPLGDSPDPGIPPVFPTLAGGFFTTEPPGKSFNSIHPWKKTCPKLLLISFFPGRAEQRDRIQNIAIRSLHKGRGGGGKPRGTETQQETESQSWWGRQVSFKTSRQGHVY